MHGLMKRLNGHSRIVSIIDAAMNCGLKIAQAVGRSAEATDTPAPPATNIRPYKTNLEARWSAMRTDWPQAGGRDFGAADPGLFTSRGYKKRYEPGDVVEIRVARSEATEKLAHKLRVPLAIVIAAQAGNTEDETRPAPASWRPFANLMPSSGALFIQRLRAVKPACGSPALANDDTISVTLPSSLSRHGFLKEFSDEAGKGAIASWIATTAGAAHCASIGLAPAAVVRRARAASRCDASAADTDVLAFRPRADPQRLVEIAERIVLRHLGLTH